MAARVRQPGWWYPWIFVGGMGLVIVVNAILVYFAVSSWTGLQTENHYRKGLAYNEALTAAREQELLGWTMAVAFDPAFEGKRDGSADGQPAAGTGELSVRFNDRLGQPITDLEARAIVIRPTQEGHDQTLALRHVGEGHYASALTLPLPGQWEARILAHRGDQAFQKTRRLYVPE